MTEKDVTEKNYDEILKKLSEEDNNDDEALEIEKKDLEGSALEDKIHIKRLSALKAKLEHLLGDFDIPVSLIKK